MVYQRFGHLLYFGPSCVATLRTYHKYLLIIDVQCFWASLVYEYHFCEVVNHDFIEYTPYAYCCCVAVMDLKWVGMNLFPRYWRPQSNTDLCPCDVFFCCDLTALRNSSPNASTSASGKLFSRIWNFLEIFEFGLFYGFVQQKF